MCDAAPNPLRAHRQCRKVTLAVNATVKSLQKSSEMEVLQQPAAGGLDYKPRRQRRYVPV